ncbi:uncharacterized protein MONOS_8957 [Monocercomonoides exilis]|uniref:uncharacterized protein n=1 Tax=Monocercomonoides exilis TaxID=2049356 RepID=UPI00355A39FE|nr:hypothetical protein MONOS_8957 [Monocercomonoides exilis]|eukprot:MONOS_8957.1-p1 / transcript=MONOS_8957.1 / gene=MONOS_8957 / organism=Monocercomonoides_exilis_PA203 / gene_product=unspecified product / transcript_product=unspecified product / location=Mono_scaffold00353:33993-34900(+) / protein_length=147 / sequence_SO=supercontig / SO=protein_coding / is_pseudo=false
MNQRNILELRATYNAAAPSLLEQLVEMMEKKVLFNEVNAAGADVAEDGAAAVGGVEAVDDLGDNRRQGQTWEREALCDLELLFRGSGASKKKFKMLFGEFEGMQSKKVEADKSVFLGFLQNYFREEAAKRKEAMKVLSLQIILDAC